MDAGQDSGAGDVSGVKWNAIAIRLLVAAMPGIGMLLFTVYLHSLTGVWFAWARSHEAWGRTYHGLAPFATAWGWVRDEPLVEVIANVPFNTLNTIAVLFGLALTYPVFRRLGAAWGVFVLAQPGPAALCRRRSVDGAPDVDTVSALSRARRHHPSPRRTGLVGRVRCRTRPVRGAVLHLARAVLGGARQLSAVSDQLSAISNQFVSNQFSVLSISSQLDAVAAVASGSKAGNWILEPY